MTCTASVWINHAKGNLVVNNIIKHMTSVAIILAVKITERKYSPRTLITKRDFILRDRYFCEKYIHFLFRIYIQYRRL